MLLQLPKDIDMARTIGRILLTPAALLSLFACGSTAQSLYWIDAGFHAPRLVKSDTDGSNAVVLSLDSLSLPQGLDRSPVDGALYWTELKFAGAAVRRVGADLGVPGAVMETGSALRGIAVDSDWIYITSSNLITGPRIERVRIDGSMRDTLIALDRADGNPRAIVLDTGERKMYWCEFSSGKICRAEMKTGAIPENVVTGLEGPVGLALDVSQNLMYWTEANANTLRRSTLSGDSVTTLVAGLATPNYLALDPVEGTLYWGEIGTPSVQRANRDGSQVETLPVTVSHPTGILVTPSGAVGVSETGTERITTFSLSQNFPNPFNPTTTIQFSIVNTQLTMLTVYDVLGREVAALVHEVKQPGRYIVQWDAGGMASGLYMYRLQAGSFVDVKKLILLK